jgi:hypothetical protein
MAPMQDRVAGHIEIVNKLRARTAEGALLWERAGDYGAQYSVLLSNGFRATVQKVPAGSVVLTMQTPQGVATVHLDSSRSEDLLKMALLQLYVTVRDTVVKLITKDAIEAVEGL